METSVMSRRRLGYGSSLHTDLQEYVSSKKCTIRIALKAYKLLRWGCDYSALLL